MADLVVWEFEDGYVVVTTTEKEHSMIEAYKAGGWDFEEADRTAFGNEDAVEFRPGITVR